MSENWKTELMEFVFYLVNPNESHVPQIYTDFELAIAREITGAFTHKGLGGTHISLYMDSWNNVSVTHHWLGVGQVIEVYSIQLSPEALFLELERRCRAIFESFSERLRAAPDNPNGWSWLYCASNQLNHLKYIRQKHICVHQIEGQPTHYFGGYEELPGSYVECKACGERLYDYYMYELEEGV